MKGFIVFQNQTGQLLYSKNYNSLPFTTSQQVPEPSQTATVSGASSSISRQQSAMGAQNTSSIARSVSRKQTDKSSQPHPPTSSAAYSQSSAQQAPTVDAAESSPAQPQPASQSKKFSKESVDYNNNQIDDQDPEDLAYKFFTIMQVTKLMGEEYKEMYPNQYYKDPSTKMAFRDGFT